MSTLLKWRHYEEADLDGAGSIRLLLAAGCSRQPGADTTAENEKKFQESMSGVTLVGSSTRLNKEGLAGEERYTIDKVSKITGDR